MLPMPTHPDSDPVLAEMSMLCMSHDPARRPTFHDIVEILDAKFNQHAEVHGAESLMETYRKVRASAGHREQAAPRCLPACPPAQRITLSFVRLSSI